MEKQKSCLARQMNNWALTKQGWIQRLRPLPASLALISTQLHKEAEGKVFFEYRSVFTAVKYYGVAANTKWMDGVFCVTTKACWWKTVKVWQETINVSKPFARCADTHRDYMVNYRIDSLFTPLLPSPLLLPPPPPPPNNIYA